MRDEYGKFLRTVNLEVWSDCLVACSNCLKPARDAAADDELVQALVISLYVQWLSGVTGDAARQQTARETSARITEALDSRHRRRPTAATMRGWAIVTGWRGYKVLARQLISQAENPTVSRQAAPQDFSKLPPGISVEVALLLVSDDPARQASELRPLISAPGTPLFPPAVWIYCDSLISLGAIQQADALLRSSGLEGSNPLLLDLRGQIHERAGRWRDAADIYGASSWPAHRYRAAVCRVIAGQPNQQRLVLDDGFVRAMARFDPEIDQGELARSSAFVNACMWSSFEDWIVDFELGKLSFRRRRYGEADAHFRRALDRAPGPCRATIASIRATNLTWLSDSRWWADVFHLGLNMRPEALERTSDALEIAGEQSGFEHLRIWLAAESEDNSLLPPSIAGWSAYSGGLAHQLVGNRPESIRCWIESLGLEFHHRNVLKLIQVFRTARFEATWAYLTDLIIQECWYDFSALWELAGSLLSALHSYGESSEQYSRVIEHLRKAWERMNELAQFEFQHLLRAHESFSSAGRQDIAESILRRAAGLAEGPAECLAVAVAQRRLPWFNSSNPDPLARRLLEQAARESRDRLERLQVAREFFEYGQVERGREILQDEGVFDEAQHLEHIEYIIALQCSSWLKPEETERLAQRATEAVKQGSETGANRRYEWRFVQRITATVTNADSALASRLRRTWVSPQPEKEDAREKAGLAAQAWKHWSDAMEKHQSTDDFEGEQTAFRNKMRELSTASAFEDGLATWCWVQDQVSTALDTAATARPDDKNESRPICKTLTLEEDPRALRLCDLWRQVLASTDEVRTARGREQIRAFYDEEKELLRRWEDRRRQKSERPLRRALLYMGEGGLLLDVIASGLTETSHPVLASLRQAIREDCEQHRVARMRTVNAIEKDLGLRAESGVPS